MDLLDRKIILNVEDHKEKKHKKSKKAALATIRSLLKAQKITQHTIHTTLLFVHPVGECNGGLVNLWSGDLLTQDPYAGEKRQEEEGQKERKEEKEGQEEGQGAD